MNRWYEVVTSARIREMTDSEVAWPTLRWGGEW